MAVLPTWPEKLNIRIHLLEGTGGYQEQQLVQQQLPPPHVVEAPGATVTVRPPVAVLPTWPEKLSMCIHLLPATGVSRCVRTAGPINVGE
ncbi:hypothetical protein Lfu02_08140 [Longispora fulva]|nr:hypothetical protein Lfu02_08140 [Longispora fulva]